MLINKEGKSKSYLIFNYYFIYKDLVGSYIKLVVKVYNLLGLPMYIIFF